MYVCVYNKAKCVIPEFWKQRKELDDTLGYIVSSRIALTTERNTVDLDLEPILKTSHYVYAHISKPKRIQLTSVPACQLRASYQSMIPCLVGFLESEASPNGNFEHPLRMFCVISLCKLLLKSPIPH